MNTVMAKFLACFGLLMIVTTPAFSECRDAEIYHDQTVCICCSAAQGNEEEEAGGELNLTVEQKGFTEVYIEDETGNRVRTLVSEVRSPSISTIFWDGTDDEGKLLSGGNYTAVFKGEGSDYIRREFINNAKVVETVEEPTIEETLLQETPKKSTSKSMKK